jgi:hypothetical protein
LLAGLYLTGDPRPWTAWYGTCPENGALLEFSEPVIPRHEVDLCILSRAESLRACVVWCNGVRAGVSIEQPDSGSVITIETARLIRKLKADREALAKRVAQLREPV